MGLWNRLSPKTVTLQQRKVEIDGKKKVCYKHQCWPFFETSQKRQHQSLYTGVPYQNPSGVITECCGQKLNHSNKKCLEREEEMVIPLFLAGWFFLYLDCRFFLRSFDSITAFYLLDNFHIYTMTVMIQCSFTHNIYSRISFFISYKPIGLMNRKIWQHLHFSSQSIHFSST